MMKNFSWSTFQYLEWKWQKQKCREERWATERVSWWHLSPLFYVVKCWILWNQILRWTLGYRTFIREQYSGKGGEEVGLGRRRNWRSNKALTDAQRALYHTWPMTHPAWAEVTWPLHFPSDQLLHMGCPGKGIFFSEATFCSWSKPWSNR